MEPQRPTITRIQFDYQLLFTDLPPVLDNHLIVRLDYSQQNSLSTVWMPEHICMEIQKLQKFGLYKGCFNHDSPLMRHCKLSFVKIYPLIDEHAGEYILDHPEVLDIYNHALYNTNFYKTSPDGYSNLITWTEQENDQSVFNDMVTYGQERIEKIF